MPPALFLQELVPAGCVVSYSMKCALRELLCPSPCSHSVFGRSQASTLLCPLLGMALGKHGHKFGSKCPKNADVLFQTPAWHTRFSVQISWLLAQPFFLMHFKIALLLLLLLLRRFNLILRALSETCTSQSTGRKIAVAVLFFFWERAWFFLLLIRAFHISLVMQACSPDPA